MNIHPECEGMCEQHRGEVKQVKVWGGGYLPDDTYWGAFWYCENAIEIDRNKKFIVEVINETNV